MIVFQEQGPVRHHDDLACMSLSEEAECYRMKGRLWMEASYQHRMADFEGAECHQIQLRCQSIYHTACAWSSIKPRSPCTLCEPDPD